MNRSAVWGRLRLRDSDLGPTRRPRVSRAFCCSCFIPNPGLGSGRSRGCSRDLSNRTLERDCIQGPNRSRRLRLILLAVNRSTLKPCCSAG